MRHPVTLRLLQGFAVWGEWAGAALLYAEDSPRNLRGRCCMIMQLGIGTAVVLANLVFLLSRSVFGGLKSAFLSWGWRVPFPMSADLLRRQTPHWLLAAGAVVGAIMMLCEASTFLTGYAETHLPISPSTTSSSSRSARWAVCASWPALRPPASLWIALGAGRSLPSATGSRCRGRWRCCR